MWRRTVLVAATGTLLVSCASTHPSAPPRPVRATKRVRTGAPGPQHETARRTRTAHRAAAAHRWGLPTPPLPAPAPPHAKKTMAPRAGFEVRGQKALGLPPVFTGIPTRDKVVFLTIDDGAEKDPTFLSMMKELNIPYTAFLTDDEIKDDYGYFRTAQRLGAPLANHTLHHRYLPALSYAEQKREICGMQDIMAKQYGKRPTLLRPPYGNYNQDTLKAAKSCGITYVPIWESEAFIGKMDYRDDWNVHAGDIILTHFRGRSEWNGTMRDMMRSLIKYLNARGFAIARLQDYLP
ncbi:polysaccharide deacetylase family protein [Streptomyces sp. SID14478]|nr:polysaccharide deacetylase family protein [Streptomyces sp. SID14478]